jgi:hypothetical protein
MATAPSTCAIAAALAWLGVAEAAVVYTDRGISAGMREGIEAAARAGLAVEYRSIYRDSSAAA